MSQANPDPPPAEKKFLELIKELPARPRQARVSIPKCGPASATVFFQYGEYGVVDQVIVEPDSGGNPTIITPIRDDLGRLVEARIQRGGAS